MRGAFPWAAVSAEGLDLTNKRMLCDLYMRLSRTLEELDIVEEEMARLAASREGSFRYMSEQVSCIDLLLATPVSDRPMLGEASTRYELVRPADGVLAGLRAYFMKSIADL